MYNIMTPGPTKVRKNVMEKRSSAFTNPDLDLDFYEFYKNLTEKFKKVLNCSSNCYILGGEGILGLESACASLTEEGDRVLVLDNGIFGEGFADFAKLYKAEPVILKSDRTKEFDLNILEDFLKKDSNFKYATLVHCDTPSGVLNDIEKICTLLKKYNILTVVDAVSSMFGEEINFDKFNIDILCGGSQKALSAPPGLTILFVSDQAIKVMEERKTQIGSFYANILTFKNYYKDKWFPYTMPVSDLLGLDKAIDNVIDDKDIIKRHEKIAKAARDAIKASGLNLYLESGYSNTVSVVEVPENIKADEILKTMIKEHNIMIAGCFGYLAGKVVRIGHMGENANFEDMKNTMKALDQTFIKLGYKLKKSLCEGFVESYKNNI